MKKAYATLIFILFFIKTFSQTYDFHAVDSLLTATQNSVYSGKVVCMVRQNDALIYYKALGGYDSTSAALVASVSKTFSAALILNLVSQGIISLDDTIGKYIPSAGLYGKGKCTIRQCFSHTAGWPGQDTTMGSYVEDGSLTLKQAADSIIKNIPYGYSPGTAFEYGGVSMHVAGAAVEYASGQSWNNLFNTNIAVPCGLSSQSKYITSSLSNPRIAGGMRSTPLDILLLAKMILHNGRINNVQVIDPVVIQDMWHDQTNQAPIIYTPYPIGSPYTPYNQDTVRYGIGCWEDVYNPNTDQVEQISGDGLYGTSFWIDSCRNITGVIFTFATSGFYSIISNNLRIESMIRNEIGGGCNVTGINAISSASKSITLFPNPFSFQANLRSDGILLNNATLTIDNGYTQTVKQIKNICGRAVTITRDNLPAGFYFFRLTEEDKIIATGKFVISETE